MYKFERLKVWQESLELVKCSYQISNKLPRIEQSNLVDQLIRASTSVTLNIAEGSGSENDKEFSRYLFVAKKSLFEVVAIVKVINALYNIDTEILTSKTDNISRMLVALTKYLKSQSLRLKSKD